MANIFSAYAMFDQTMGKVVGHLNLNGRVIKETDYMLNRLVVAFSFADRYLTVCDFKWYEMFDLHQEKVLYDAVRHLKDIQYQFRFYFEGIWG